MSLVRPRRRKCAPCARRTPGLRVQPLESRDLFSAGTWPGFFQPLLEAEPNDTLDLAQYVGNLSVNQRAEVVGQIGGGAGRGEPGGRSNLVLRRGRPGPPPPRSKPSR